MSESDSALGFILATMVKNDFFFGPVRYFYPQLSSSLITSQYCTFLSMHFVNAYLLLASMSSHRTSLGFVLSLYDLSFSFYLQRKEFLQTSAHLDMSTLVILNIFNNLRVQDVHILASGLVLSSAINPRGWDWEQRCSLQHQVLEIPLILRSLRGYR